MAVAIERQKQHQQQQTVTINPIDNVSPVHTTGANTNLMAVLYGPNDLRMEERITSAPSEDECQIHIRATGLCGSDLHYYCHGKNGQFALQHPMCLGHESVGEIIAFGPNTKTNKQFKLQQRIAIEPGQNCEKCVYCQSGRYNLCKNMRFASSAKTAPHLHGTLQRFINWPLRLCHPLPDHVDMQSAALAEPLAVVLQALKRSRFVKGQSVLVIGAGAVGMLACAASKHFQASTISAIDVSQNRLDLAKDLDWCNSTYLNTNVNQFADEKELMQHIKSTLKDVDQDGFDVVYECTGVPTCVRTAIHAAKPGGVVCMIGMGHPTMTLPMDAAALREVDLVGVFRYANMFPQAIELLSNSPVMASLHNGKPIVQAILSHTFPLARADQAFETMKAGKSADGKGVMKVMVVDEEN